MKDKRRNKYESINHDDEPLARNELTYLLNEIGGFEEINEAENVKETLEALLINQYDIIFLDVNLMDENGIELGAKIQKMKEPPAIIFATAHDQYAVQAFELNATDYILKPFGQNVLNKQSIKFVRLKPKMIIAQMQLRMICRRILIKVYLLKLTIKFTC